MICSSLEDEMPGDGSTFRRVVRMAVEVAFPLCRKE